MMEQFDPVRVGIDSVACPACGLRLESLLVGDVEFPISEMTLDVVGPPPMFNFHIVSEAVPDGVHDYGCPHCNHTGILTITYVFRRGSPEERVLFELGLIKAGASVRIAGVSHIPRGIIHTDT